jgi:hypothetical protein
VFLREMSDKINRILPTIMTTKTYGKFLYSALLTIFATYIGKPGDLPYSWSELSKTTQNILQTSFLNNLDSFVSAASSSSTAFTPFVSLSSAPYSPNNSSLLLCRDFSYLARLDHPLIKKGKSIYRQFEKFISHYRIRNTFKLSHYL